MSGKCWVLFCFCSTLMTCHRILLLMVICLPMMSYRIISGKITVFQNILINWSGKTVATFFNNNKGSVSSIHDNAFQQPYYLNNSRLQDVLNHPYIGIDLIFDLKWEKHITNIIAKASRTLGMLSRVLKIAETRQLAFNTLM